MIRQNSTYLSLLMPELRSLLCLKLYSLNYAFAHVQKKIVTLIRICHSCVALKHKKTDVSLETRAEISFEFITFVNIVNCVPLTKTNRKC